MARKHILYRKYTENTKQDAGTLRLAVVGMPGNNDTLGYHTGAHSDAQRPVLRHLSALPVDAGTRGRRCDERAHL